MKSYISSLGTAAATYRTSQMKIAEFMADAAEMSDKERQRLIALYKASGINARYSVIPDFGRENGSYEFFPNTKALEPFPSVLQRMRLYEKEALPLSLKAIDKCFQNLPELNKENITHLITVSCTGMYAPGLDLEITEALGLRKSIQRTCINYMGCYAAFNALKVADAFCKSDPDAVVLIVSVELCTIHYQKKKTWDDILSNAIFGDGAAAAIVQRKKPSGYSLSIESFYCDIASEGKKDMAWNISDFGFEMTLSSYVPSLIKKGIKILTDNLLRNSSINLKDIDVFAIHPGGKKILEVIEEELAIERSKTQFSFDILKDYGNMSSATILFVLEKIFYSGEKGAYKNLLSFAFGPGLTLESMMLKAHAMEGNNPGQSFIKEQIESPLILKDE